jgi:hypothetical protein
VGTRGFDDIPSDRAALVGRAETAAWIGDLTTAWHCYEELTGMFFTPRRTDHDAIDPCALGEFAWIALACGRLVHARQIARYRRDRACARAEEQDCEVQLAVIAARLGKGATAELHAINAALARDPQVPGPNVVRTLLWELEALRGRPRAPRIPSYLAARPRGADVARWDLLRAAHALPEDPAAAHRELEIVRAWVEENGHHETRVRAHVLASAIALARGEHSLALSEAQRGQSCAERSGHELHAIDALVAQARARLAGGDARAAISTATNAIARASHPFCSYAWGHGDAAYLLGLGRIMEREWPQAIEALEVADRIQRRAQVPELDQTLELLEVAREVVRAQGAGSA